MSMIKIICPNCGKDASEAKEYPAYHNRIRYVCPHCGYDGDSVEFTCTEEEPSEQKSSGIELIAEERQRQIEKEGWTREHDARHRENDLAVAAAAYALPDAARSFAHIGGGIYVPIFWPFDVKWWKPTPEDRVKELVKAGALIAAEIDRLLAK